MRFRFPRSLLAALLAALPAACAPGGPAPSGPEPDPALEVAWDSASSPDSVAAWARARCGGWTGARRDCLERSLRAVTDKAGVGLAMAALDRIAAPGADERMIPEAHAMAHGLGIAAYRGPETMAKVFAECPFTQVSGCQHGVIQAFFLDMRARGTPLGSAELDAVCTPHREVGPRFAECSHGLGHGVMAFAKHHLPKALETCDKLSDGYVRESCYGGAFMENIVGATHPQHTAESHAALGGAEGGDGHEHGAAHSHGGGEGGGEAGHDAHGEHGEHGDSAEAEPAWKPLDPADPLYPCTIVTEKHWQQCYMIQTAAILANNGGDVAKTAETCRGAPATMVEVCWRSLGRDLTSYAERDPARTNALCARVDGDAYRECVAGAAISLTDVRRAPADGAALCRLAEGDTVRGRCWFVVGGMARALSPEPARAEFCATAEEPFVSECRRGAGLPAKPATAATNAS